MVLWHETILSAQGFGRCRVTAYEELKVLAIGSQGKITLVQHKNSGCRYAVKTVRETESLNRKLEYIEPLLMQHLSDLDEERSSGFVKTVETFECGGNYCTVMEFYEEGNLLEFLLQDGNLQCNETFAKRVIYQTTQALQTLHSMDIIHRDIKLQNIMV